MTTDDLSAEIQPDRGFSNMAQRDGGRIRRVSSTWKSRSSPRSMAARNTASREVSRSVDHIGDGAKDALGGRDPVCDRR